MGDETTTGGNPEARTPEMEALNKCLNSVYLATEANIADDINRIVRAAVESLQAENKLQAQRIEEYEKYRAFFFGCAGFPYDADTAELTDYVERGEALKDKLEALHATAELVEKWKESAGLARYYLESYSNDADDATHAKRVLDNALTALGGTT